MVSFFENRKILGFVLWVIAIFAIAEGIGCIVDGFSSDSSSFIPDEADNREFYGCLSGIGMIIAGLIYALFSSAISRGAVSKKIDILAGLVRMVGLTTIITGIFDGIAWILCTDEIGAGIVSTIISILIGALIMWIGGRINDGKADVGDIIIWLVLLVLMLILVLLLFLALIGATLALDLGLILVILEIVCKLILYLFVIAFLCDRGVRKSMNM